MASTMLRDEDRLPWLETVDEDYDEGGSPLRTILIVLAGLVLVAAVVLGGMWLMRQVNAPTGNGELIAAQEGDYKVRPSDPGGVRAREEGSETLAASQGTAPAEVKLDARQMPEAPVTMPAPGDATGSGGALIQLGSFPSQDLAEAAWARNAKRFAWLAPLGHSVERAEVNGSVVHRLRVNAGSAGQAKDYCARLEVAGEACFVAR